MLTDSAQNHLFDVNEVIRYHLPDVINTMEIN